MTTASPPWVVMKFGGTSVSTAPNWQNIARLVRTRLDEGLRPLVVHSALATISNHLEAIALRPGSLDVPAVVSTIENAHRALARDLGLDADELLTIEFGELRRLSSGVSLLGEASPKVHARLMALGELMATRLGAAFLSAQGIPSRWLDAREHLESISIANAAESATYLSAQCAFEPDPGLAGALAESTELLLTQGFIARNSRGETVLLGRGGSDTSASYLGAKLSALRVEIWTDVPGMFTADPRTVPDARLLRVLDYDEAQEIATTGAKVLHPRCIAPVRSSRIALWVVSTVKPALPGTVIGPTEPGAPQVKAVSVKKKLVVVSMDTLGMWQQVGFLADAFACFKQRGLSVDLMSTSESNVTVTLDPTANSLTDEVLDGLARDLAPLCRVRVVRGCAAVSLVGRQIRAILPKLGPALEVFAEHALHLVSQAASDLNLSFVVDEEHADRLARDLHDLLLQKPGPSFGPTWQELSSQSPSTPERETRWWEQRRDELLALVQREGSPRYVYDGPTIDAAARALRSMQNVERVLYAVKANPHPGVLARLEAAGVGFECVSPGEVTRVRELFPAIEPARVLFTPNFAPRDEYAWALEQGVRVTLDNAYALASWPELFRDREVFVRVDLGRGRGHHAHVRTAGAGSKFGVPVEELDELAQLAKSAGARVVGLHSHAGSGVLQPQLWGETAAQLAGLTERFTDVHTLDLGGGLGIAYAQGDSPLDLGAVDRSLAAVRSAYPKLALWIEPGRYLVARAGVLLARVTQRKGKGERAYVGIDAGMNSLIRPALYGAWHEIVNLSRAGDPAAAHENVTVVGPICESGDVLGSERVIASPREGDVLLVADAGAYGHAMGSRYNLREPAAEVLLG